jgi:iron complex transport system permease protein
VFGAVVKKSSGRFLLLILACLAFLLVSIIISTTLGSIDISFKKVASILTAHLFSWAEAAPGTGTSVEDSIIWQIRFPRVLLALFLGMGLSAAGAGFQGVLRNPLAEPYLLGVSSGCALGAVIAIITGWKNVLGIWSLPFFAFLSGFISLFIVYRIAAMGKSMQVESIILSGVILNAFLSAVLAMLLILNGDEQSEILFWLMGSLSLKSWPMVWVLIPYVLAGTAALWLLARVMNIFSLGDKQAFHTGVSVTRLRLAVLCISSLTAAACVSVSGIIGFIGLVVPHLARLLTGPDYRKLIPLSALVGGTLVLWSDNLARLVISPEELPLGVITAFLGGPFFIFLMHRKGRYS